MLIQISKKEEQISGVEMLGLIRKKHRYFILKNEGKGDYAVWFQVDWQILQ